MKQSINRPWMFGALIALSAWLMGVMADLAPFNAAPWAFLGLAYVCGIIETFRDQRIGMGQALILGAGLNLGLILNHYYWHLDFFLNVPLGWGLTVVMSGFLFGVDELSSDESAGFGLVFKWRHIEAARIFGSIAYAAGLISYLLTAPGLAHHLGEHLLLAVGIGATFGYFSSRKWLNQWILLVSWF